VAAVSRAALARGSFRLVMLASVPTLDELASDPEKARDLTAEAAAVLHTRCLLAMNALWSRQLEARRQTQPGPDKLLHVREAAAKLRKSKDWLYRHATRLPFTVRVGHQLRFSSDGIARYVRERQGLA